MVPHTELEIFYHDLTGEALLWVPPTELEIFYCDLTAKALLLVPPTEPEIFYRDLTAKALLLVPATELDIFQQKLVAIALLLVIPTVGIVEDLSTSYKSPNFGKTFSNKNIEPLAPPERLSTVSSPFMVHQKFWICGILLVVKSLVFH